MKRIAFVLAILAIAIVAHGAETTPCADCHDDVAGSMHENIHLRIKPFEVQGKTTGCQGCHGDGTAHMEQGGDPSLIVSYEDPAEWNDTCLGCHSRKGQSEWHASTHAMEGVACLDCHDGHDRGKPLASCDSCHAAQVAQFHLPSRHPVKEGLMGCDSCHDPHAATESQLKTKQRTNDLCFECHPAKEGPFIFEHEPVVEDCMMCHSPHGSVADNLLVANEPMVCLQCHELHFHTGYEAADDEVDVGGTEYESPWGGDGFTRGFTTKCTECHSQIHGTDLPSQTVPGRGRGLTR